MSRPLAPKALLAPRLLPQHVPGLDALVRPLELVERPTPVTEAGALGDRWKLGRLWIKRDDLSAPLYGGSKVRNLEFFLGHALARGATGVVTMGPLGSHQVLATAVYGRRAGLATRALLTPQPDVRESGLNRKLLPALGMEVIRCERFIDVPLGLLRARFGQLEGRAPYWIPPGSHHPIGVLGVIEGALEIARAIEAGELPPIDDVVVPTGTCATAAGLALGFAMAGLPVRVVAVRMVPMLITGPGKMRKLARRTLALLRQAGYARPVTLGEILWLDQFAGPGYGLPNALSDRAALDVAELADFRTETTYVAKTLALFQQRDLQGRRVLFWNTYSAVDPDPAAVQPEHGPHWAGAPA
ncbi:1-aminocyclopropane-1-carboxylate deaminase/D-cysteine desulfhydrase [Caenimonas terrae]|uniref:1-aminocyclopropane-1-carboxylate deaminase/D-cysteine desulfhydrase n=1 Tax=Caenimonas terrae TaxID=696074 RepID=A0ABW0NBY6_9BURK